MADVVYKVQIGDEILEFEGPDGLSDQQISELGTQFLATAKPGETFGAPVVKRETSAVGTFARSLPKDVSFNFSDELAARANAVIPGFAALDNLAGMSGGEQTSAYGDLSYDQAVNRNLADLRGQFRADEEAHPFADFAGRIGGVITTLPRAAGAVVSRLPQAATNLAARFPILSGMTIGGVSGTASGAGAGEKGTRGQSAAIGGLGGTVFGGLVPGAMELAPVVSKYFNVFMNHMPEKEAIAQTIKALARDGFDVISPNGVQKLKDVLQSFTGKPVSLADIGGATRTRTGVGLRTPSDTQQQTIAAINERTAGQGPRIARDIRANVAPRTDVHALDTELRAQREAEAQLGRERALFVDAEVPGAPTTQAQVVPTGTVDEPANAGLMRQMGQDVPDNPTFRREMVPTGESGLPTTMRTSRIVEDPTLQQLARHPYAQRALDKALANAEAERIRLAAEGLPTDHLPDLASRGADLDMRTFDYLKRYMDKQIDTLYKRGETDSFSMAEAHELEALRDSIRERLKVAVPEYGEYLKKYGDSSEMIKALDEGRAYTQLDPEEIVAGQAKRSDAGQEYYRVGAARDMLDTIRNTRDTAFPASRILNTPEAREQAASLGIPDVNLANLNRSVQQERVLNLLPDELRGAATQGRQAAAADANAGANLEIPWNVGSPTGWLRAGLQRVGNQASVERNAAINAEILPRLTATDPATINATIDELVAAGRVAEAAALQRQARERVFAGIGGITIGGVVARPGEQ